MKIKRTGVKLASELFIALTLVRIRKIAVPAKERIPPAPYFHQAHTIPANPMNQNKKVAICIALKFSNEIFPVLL